MCRCLGSALTIHRTDSAAVLCKRISCGFAYKKRPISKPDGAKKRKKKEKKNKM